LATPLDLGALPFFLLEAAEVKLRLFISNNEDLPKDPTEKIDTIFFTPEGIFTKDNPVRGSVFTILALDPGLLAMVDKVLGWTSMLLT
jgi:hypothetical protein